VGAIEIAVIGDVYGNVIYHREKFFSVCPMIEADSDLRFL
jgi:hypothetical protein